MKILVDKMPETYKDCQFSMTGTEATANMTFDNMISSFGFGSMGKIDLNKDIMCHLSKNKGFKCLIGRSGFECPFLREFKAQSVEPIGDPTKSTRVARVIPVELKDE